MGRRATPFQHWSTGTKLLILLTLALFPLGLALAWTARTNLHDSHRARIDDSHADGRVSARAVESLIARNALALRVAANGALRAAPRDSCGTAAQSLSLTPGVANRFSMRDASGRVICTQGNFIPSNDDALVAPGAIRAWIDAPNRSIRYRVGIDGGMATGELTVLELARAIRDSGRDVGGLTLRDSHSTLPIISPAAAAAPTRIDRYGIASGQLTALVRSTVAEPGLIDRLAMFLPLLMWVIAALLSWYLVRRLLLVPLARLQRAVSDYQPGDSTLVLPERLGAAEEIHALGDAFERAVDRLEQSEQQMGEALHGQRRLVREVHHRVKNNLQVVASLLNIHGRSATTVESRAAYAAIGRRVDALSVVHRNHFAEVEETRGIALRPLLSELATTLRASAPDTAPAPEILLDADALRTTQDAAVAVAFFVTELIEFAILQGSVQPIEIELRRMSELAAALTVSSTALVADGEEPSIERKQFERVVAGLARQLRSPLEQKLGRVSVNLPVFPD